VLADSCREDAYRLLIQSHAALNQIARAGAWYAVCRATLRREVSAVPSNETVGLFESLFEPARTQRRDRRASA
jgi:Bacterial transcriptional activator domain